MAADAADNLDDKPVLSASSRSSANPVCDTTPSPPTVTSRPLDQPVTFTLKVLLDLDQIRTFDTHIVPGQECFLLTRRPASIRAKSQG